MDDSVPETFGLMTETSFNALAGVVDLKINRPAVSITADIDSPRATFGNYRSDGRGKMMVIASSSSDLFD